jgi:replicative DNA helicase
VWALGGGTSWGKSSWGVMVADENLRAGNGVLIVGSEDSEGMYARRIIARRTGINAMRLRDNDCRRHDIEAIAHMVAQAENKPFLLPAVGMPAEEIARAIRELVPALGIKVVLVDYVQRIRLKSQAQDRRNEVTRVAELMSDAIKTSGAGGVLLSQLKRLEGREPIMDDLKESGDLENISEHVLVGWRTKERDGGDDVTKRYVKLEKNKDGPVGGVVEMPFDWKTASFTTVGKPEQYVHESHDDMGFDNEPQHWSDQ